VSDTISEAHLRNLPAMYVALGIAVASGVLALAVVVHRGDKPVGPPVASQATIVVFERDKCNRCEQFRDVVTRPYQLSDVAGRVPLKYYDITDGPPPRRWQLRAEIGGTPTAVSFDIFNREIGRFTGVPTSAGDIISLAQTAARRADRDNERYQNDQ
jgi:hypothetical protein